MPTSRANKFIWLVAFFGILFAFATGQVWAEKKGKAKQAPQAASFDVEGEVALAAFMALGDGHLQKFADTFRLLATREEVLTGDWSKIKGPLTLLAKTNAPAVVWFALPSGEYWTVQEDQVDENLASRSYFSRVLTGQTVLGELVVSKSTGKNVAIVAVPVMKNNKVVGVLGCSVYLDQLSDQIKREMALRSNMIFYSFDAEPLLALVYDKGLIFNRPKDLGPEIDQAFRKMLTQEQGSIVYSYREKTRTVLFQKSKVTGWWYAFGLVNETTALQE